MKDCPQSAFVETTLACVLAWTTSAIIVSPNFFCFEKESRSQKSQLRGGPFDLKAEREDGVAKEEQEEAAASSKEDANLSPSFLLGKQVRLGKESWFALTSWVELYELC